MINTNPNMDVNLAPAISAALHKRGRVEDNQGAGLQDQSIYGQPVIAAGAPAGGKKPRKPRAKKAAPAAEPVAAVVEVKAVEGEAKPKRKGGNAKGSAAAKGAAAKNPWLQHVKKVKGDNPKLSLKEVMLKAKESYKK